MSLFNKRSLRPLVAVNPLGLVEDFLSGGQTTTTTSNELPSTLKPLGEAAVTGLLGTQAPTAFPGQTVADQSTATTQGISGLSDAAAAQQGVAGTTGDAFNWTLNNMLDPASNQALQAYIQSAINPIFDRLENQTLPGIGGQAIQAGQFGGTAQTNLTRDALTDATRNAGDITSGIASNAYNTGLDNFTNTLLNAGNVQQVQSNPAQTQIAGGSLTDDYTQRLIDAEVAKYNFDQTAETDYWTNILNSVNAAQPNQTTVQEGGGTDPINTAMSAYLMWQLSDRRLKRDIKAVGKLPSGLKIYEFRYFWSQVKQIGVMAQEALKVIPEAVSKTVGDYYVVDYSLIK